MSRTNMEEVTARQELERRMAAQLPEEEKVKLAHFVLDNSGDEASTEARVREVYAQLRQLAART
jgi:dephospho-CoA kinase